MNTLEPLDYDVVVSLDNPDDKFCGPRHIFRTCEMRHSLSFFATDNVDAKWFRDGVACEILIPNYDWRAGKATFQLCFLEDLAEDKESNPHNFEVNTTPLPFRHSTGLIEIPDKETGVVSLDEANDSFTCISRTLLLSQVAKTVLKPYEPDQPGYKWIWEGVPCSVLSPNMPWRRGKVRLQACFVEDVVEEAKEELVEDKPVVNEEPEANSDATVPDPPTEFLSPLDEIRQMSDELR